MDEGRAAKKAFVGFFEKQLPEGSASALPEFEIGEVMCKCDDRPLFRITRRDTEEVFLLQMFSPEVIADQETHDRFVQGLLKAREIESEGALKIVDCRVYDGWYYLIHEHFESVTLLSHYEAGERQPQELVRLIAYACEPLHAAYAVGLRHANLSVHSILIGEENDVKVANIGVSDFLYPTDADYIQSLAKNQSGARPYVAPERLMDDRISDHRSDIYSLAAIVYHVLVGSPPSGFAVLPSTRADIEKRVDVVTMKAMHNDPEKRHGAVELFAADLRRLGAGNKNDPYAAAGFGKKARKIGGKPIAEEGGSYALKLAACIALVIAVLGGGWFFGKDYLASMIEDGPPETLPGGVKVSDVIPILDTGKREAALAVAIFILRQTARSGGGSSDAISDNMDTVIAGGDHELALELGMGALATANPDMPDFRRIEQKVKELEHRINGHKTALAEADEAREAGDVKGEMRALMRAKALLPEDSKLDERIKMHSGDTRSEIEDVVRQLEEAHPGGGELRHSLEEEEGMFSLDLSNNPQLTDISALSGLPLTGLNISNTGVKDIAPLKDMPLDTLHMDGTGVEDIEPVKDMPLSTITAEGAPIKNPLFVKEMLTVVNYRFGKGNRERRNRVARPKAGRGYVNSIGMRLRPMFGKRRRLLSVWETRVSDFEKFVEATAHPTEMGMFAVAGHEWKKFAFSWDNPGFEQKPSHPAVGISAVDAANYCQWLTEKETEEGLLREGDHYRLPTSEEWDIAAGQTKTMSVPFVWGLSWPPPSNTANFPGIEVFEFITEASTLKRIPGPKPVVLADYEDDYPYTSPVGYYHSDLPFRDLGGNVREWCSDVIDGVNGTRQIVRGAAWIVVGNDKAHRIYQLGRIADEIPEGRYANLGFRVMLELAEPKRPDESLVAAAMEAQVEPGK